MLFKYVILKYLNFKFQCKYGHLLCAGCFNDILAESRQQNEIASCPKCQTTITKDLCFRNVAAEETIAELPVACSYCSKEHSPNCIKFHEAVCKQRYMSHYINF